MWSASHTVRYSVLLPAYLLRHYTSSLQIGAGAAVSSDKSLPVPILCSDCQAEGLTAHYLCQQLNLSRNHQVIFCT